MNYIIDPEKKIMDGKGKHGESPVQTGTQVLQDRTQVIVKGMYAIFVVVFFRNTSAIRRDRRKSFRTKRIFRDVYLSGRSPIIRGMFREDRKKNGIIEKFNGPSFYILRACAITRQQATFNGLT